MASVENKAGKYTGSYLAVAPQIDTERSKKAIYHAFVHGVQEKLTAFCKELDAGIALESALQIRLDEFRLIRNDFKFYKEALHFQFDDLEVMLNDLTKQVKHKLNNWFKFLEYDTRRN